MVDFASPGALGLPSVSYSGSPVTGVAPPGMEPVVQQLKRHKDVSNPWAVAWWLKKHGRQRGMGMADMATLDRDVTALIAQAKRSGIPAVFVEAANGASWAQTYCLTETAPLYEERR